MLLTGYLDAWIGIIGQRFPHALLIDGFAGPGEYLAGEPGSPILMLDAFLSRPDRDTLKPVFHFLFIEADEERCQHLRNLVANRPGHRQVDVHVVEGDFSVCFNGELAKLRSRFGASMPTFAFIDPFGAGDDAMHLAADLVGLPRCEALVYVPITYLARFVTVADMQPTLEKLYPDGSWRPACEVAALDQRRQILQDAMIQRLRQSCEWVRPFEIVPEVGKNSYTLFFGTNNPLGLRRMKAAMWKLDPGGGLRFTDSASVDHPVLFEAQPDLGRLDMLLRDKFGSEATTIEELSKYTLEETPYRDDGHLKPVLAAAERTETLTVVDAKAGRRRCTFPPGTVVRFQS